jgi:hypothetical protein
MRGCWGLGVADSLAEAFSQVQSDLKTTAYFDAIHRRKDRTVIQDEWFQRAIKSPLRETIQGDGRVRRWIQVSEVDNRYLRVILLSDRETVHNAFFDRRFKP